MLRLVSCSDTPSYGELGEEHEMTRFDRRLTSRSTDCTVSTHSVGGASMRVELNNIVARFNNMATLLHAGIIIF